MTTLPPVNSVLTGRSNTKARRIKYELSRRFCREIFNTSVKNVPLLKRQRAVAVMLQSTWREYVLQQALQRARNEEHEKRRSAVAATLIQARVRVYLMQCRAKLAEAEQRENASIRIAAAVRRMLSVLEVERLNSNVSENYNMPMRSSFKALPE